MDYEKAYKASIETAKQWIKDGCSVGEQSCLECVFPELRKSEDERVIRTLFSLCKDHDWLNGATKEECINWLEKQKEIPMPTSTELIEMWDKEESMLKKKDFRGDEWRLAYNAFMDGFARGTCVKFEKQKEQKPSCGNVNVESEFDKGWRAGHKAGLKDAEQQKPAEWSEEDTQMLARIIERGQSQIQMFETGLLPEHIAWLKSLRPSWKPTEDEPEYYQHFDPDC